MMQKVKNFLEICGGIATGKTTLCQKLSEKGMRAIFEDFQTNPFWENFYCEPQLFAFETELSFHLQHYSSIKINLKQKKFVCDFSLVQDLAYADINLNYRRHELFCDVANELRDEVGFPKVLIYIYCPEVVQLHRIQARNRLPERTITENYLRALNVALEKRVHQLEGVCRVVRIDSSKIDFRAGIPENIGSFI